MTIELLKNNIDCMQPLLAAYKKAIGEEPLSGEQMNALQKAITQGHILFFVAKEDGEAAAMCSITKTFSTYCCQYSAIFEDFYILPNYRKNGLARELTRFVFDYCQKNGIGSLWVGCADCDVAMYRHLGFTIPLGNLLAWSAD